MCVYKYIYIYIRMYVYSAPPLPEDCSFDLGSTSNLGYRFEDVRPFHTIRGQYPIHRARAPETGMLLIRIMSPHEAQRPVWPMSLRA